MIIGLSGVRRKLAGSSQGARRRDRSLSGVHQKLAEGIRSLLGDHRKLAEGDQELAKVASRVRRKKAKRLTGRSSGVAKKLIGTQVEFNRLTWKGVN
ncbi:hypothetical protein GW17_00007462 [Ensete ventricosum]|nr:hypothetical protein GW17_00007462 [Ensete ventricosum]